MFTDLHSLCRQVAFPGKCYGRGDTFTQWCSRLVVGIAKHEHRSPPVHCINRADTRLVAAPLLSQMLSLDVFAMYFTVVHSVQIPRTTGQYMKLCNLKVLHEALPLVLLAVVVQVPALFRRVLVLAQLVRVLVADLEYDCILC